MKGFRYMAALIVIGAASSSAAALCYANNEAAQPMRANADECTAHANQAAAPAGSASKPPVLSIGVSDPGTKLNLPWFLTDIVNAVNTHQSAHCLLHALKSGI